MCMAFSGDEGDAVCSGMAWSAIPGPGVVMQGDEVRHGERWRRNAGQCKARPG